MASASKSFHSHLIIVLTVLTALYAIVILTGAGLNDLGHKYSKSLSHDDCTRELLVLHIPHSQMCCDDDIHASDWVCIAGFDRINRIMSSKWAYVLPVIPFGLTVITDLIVQGSLLKSIWIGAIVRYIVIFLVFIVRFVSFASSMRTFHLYFIFNHLLCA